MLKKAICILWLFIMLIPFVVSTESMAAGALKFVYIDEKEISIAIPEDYLIITRSTETLDQAFDFLGLSLADIKADMIIRNIYLYAFSPDFDRRIEVTISPDGMFSTEGVDMEEAFLDIYEGDHSEFGLTITKKEFYHYGENTYLLVLAYMNDNPNTNLMQATTLEDNRVISIVHGSYVGEFNNEDEDLMKKMLNASILKKHKNTDNISNESPNTDYYDEVTPAFTTEQEILYCQIPWLTDQPTVFRMLGIHSILDENADDGRPVFLPGTKQHIVTGDYRNRKEYKCLVYGIAPYKYHQEFRIGGYPIEEFTLYFLPLVENGTIVEEMEQSRFVQCEFRMETDDCIVAYEVITEELMAVYGEPGIRRVLRDIEGLRKEYMIWFGENKTYAQVILDEERNAHNKVIVEFGLTDFDNLVPSFSR